MRFRALGVWGFGWMLGMGGEEGGGETMYDSSWVESRSVRWKGSVAGCIS